MPTACLYGVSQPFEPPGYCHTCVNVNFDGAVGNRGPEVLDAGAGATVKHKEHRLVILLPSLELVGNELLMLGEKLGMEFNITTTWLSVPRIKSQNGEGTHGW